MAKQPKDNPTKVTVGSGQMTSDSVPPHYEAKPARVTPASDEVRVDGQDSTPDTTIVEPAEPRATATPSLQDDTIADHGDRSRPTAPVTPEDHSDTSSRSGGGFFPALLGGLVAAGIGFGAGYMMPRTNDAPQMVDFDPEALRGAQADQAERLSALDARIDALPPAADLSQIEQSLSDAETRSAEAREALSAKLDEQAATLSGQAETISTLRERLDAIETRRQERIEAGEENISAYEQDLVALRDEMSAQKEELSKAAEDAASRLEALEADAASVRDVSTQLRADAEEARAQAEAAREEAQAARQLASTQAALSEIDRALTEGRPYSEALSEIGPDIAVPGALAAPAQAGVPTLDALRASFAPAARLALAEARDAGESGEQGSGPLGAFLRDQFNVRSTAVRDGADADAVLSRAQAALNAGDLRAALAEVEALPPAALPPMADWIDAARTRLGAVSAAHDISTRLTEK